MTSIHATTTTSNMIEFKDKCNALDCNSLPTVKLDIDCGNYGSLTIFVCECCSHKFERKGN